MRTIPILVFPVLLVLHAAPCFSADLVLEQPEKHGGFAVFAFSPDSRFVAGGTIAVASKSGSHGGEVVLWDARTGELLETPGSHGETVDWVAFAREGQLIFGGSQKSGLIQAWSRGKAGPPVLRLEPGTPFSESVPPEVSPDGRRLAFVTEHRTKVSGKPRTRQTPLKIFDLETREMLWSREGPDVRALAMHPGGKLLAVYLKQNWKNNGRTRLLGRAAKQTIELRRLATGDLVHTIERTWYVHALAFHPDGKSLAAVTNRELIRWSAWSGAELGRFSIEGKHTPRGIALANEGSRVAVPRFMGERVELWDLGTKTVAAALTTSFPNTIWRPAFSPSLVRMACVRGSLPVVVDLAALAATD